ncbi:MAG TPA: NAD-dependent epimerase/dehydratase family protein [Pirellulales bacterium]|nr:NAD-dependent epimerase/dehydratase family protein [Pirellulales bacterium]
MVEPPEDEEQLDELLSRPSEQVIDALGRLPGDLVVCGASGKMGPSLAQMAKRASDAAGLPRRVFGVARFTEGGEQRLQAYGIEPIRCDLLDEEHVMGLPDAQNVIFMAGRKFGSTGDEGLTWATNAWLPTLVCRRYRRSRIVAFSTGNIYGLVPVVGGGSREIDVPQPVGEYAMSCLARERLIGYFSRQYGTPVAIVRLNYACDLRYGVLVDLALKIVAEQPVDLAMGHFNTIWQGDANATALLALAHAATPPWIVNITGVETLWVREVGRRLGVLLDKPVCFIGSEAPTALLSDASLAVEQFGAPAMPVEQMIEWVANWVGRGGRTLDKPTHFESRSGKY